MKNHTVADEYTIINTQGIRYVEKVDHLSIRPYTYRLQITYKGNTMSYMYPDQESRDKQFDALSKAMTENYVKRESDLLK